MRRGVPVLLLACGLGSRAVAAEPLVLRRDRPGAQNRLLVAGPVAVHAFATDRAKPRVLLAFAEGNQGGGIWVEPGAHPRGPTSIALADPVAATPPVGYTAGAEVRMVLAPPGMRIVGSLVGSLRALRDYPGRGLHPAQAELLRGLALIGDDPVLAPLAARLRVATRAGLVRAPGSPPSLVLERPAFWGPGGWRLEVVPGPGTRLRASRGGFLLTSSQAAAVATLRVFHREPPMPRTGVDGLLSRPAAAALESLGSRDPEQAARLRDRLAGLSFLAPGEKLLAGSWRYLTYFGRDTMMTALLLEKVLSPAVLDAAIDGVLARLREDGAVAHEEDLGEQAVLDRLRQALAIAGTRSEAAARAWLRDHLAGLAAPVHDYRMVDDDFMLLPLVERRLAALARAGAQAWLDHPLAGGYPRRVALGRNLAYVRAALARPGGTGLLEGMDAGDWRDSDRGLGGGRFAYSVDRVWVPAARRAWARLAGRGLVEAGPGASPGSEVQDRDSAYQVGLDEGTVRARVRAYLASLPPGLAAALAAEPLHDGRRLADWLGGKGPSPFGPRLRFPALALDAAGTPIPVMHSDALLRLALGLCDPAEVEDLANLSLPFPLGLSTRAGMLVANPALSGEPARWAQFDARQYHGTVAWGWVQALGIAGPGLPPKALPEDEELWGLGETPDGLGPVPYGDRADAATESNALQLWSLIRPLLALRGRPD